MQLISIRGKDVTLLYHSVGDVPAVGESVALLDMPGRDKGVVIQIVSHETVQYEGLLAQMIQRSLENQATKQTVAFNREMSMDQIKNLKVAIGKIRKTIRNGAWHAWDGHIPSRNVEIALLSPDEVISHVVPAPQHKIASFTKCGEQIVFIDGPLCDLITAIVGVKGGGKSHVAKLLAIALSAAGVPVIIYDVNNEYSVLPSAQVLAWQRGFRLNLAEVGWQTLATVINALCPLQEGTPSEGTLQNALPRLFNERQQACERRQQPFTMDVAHLLKIRWSGNDFVQEAIMSRLEQVNEMGIFTDDQHPSISLSEAYERACQSSPIVFDMSNLGNKMKTALVRAVFRCLENTMADETSSGRGRYAYTIYDEAQMYITERDILGLIARSRHHGIASIFVSNMPTKIPEIVYRQLDNIWVMPLSDRDDLRALARSSLADADTIEALVTRLRPRQALLIGRLTDRYPLVVDIDDLPSHVRRSGQTKSTWTRFRERGENCQARA